MVSGRARDSRRWTLLLPGPFCVRLSLVWKAEERRGATVSFRNGKAAALEGALEGAWNSLISKRGRWRLRKSWRMCALDALESKFFVSDLVFNSGFVSVGRGGSVCT